MELKTNSGLNIMVKKKRFENLGVFRVFSVQTYYDRLRN